MTCPQRAAVKKKLRFSFALLLYKEYSSSDPQRKAELYFDTVSNLHRCIQKQKPEKLVHLLPHSQLQRLTAFVNLRAQMWEGTSVSATNFMAVLGA